jgi:hypothetical protein
VSRAAVADAATALHHAITIATRLIARPDTTPAGAIGEAAGSAPPWNAAAANAALDATEGVRRLEPSLRLAVTGHVGPRRGGSDANTTAAIRAVVALSEAVSDDSAAVVARLMRRWVTGVQRLPAVDTAEVWQEVRQRCPYCGLGMLRACMSGERFGMVTCLRFGVCSDGDGNHPQGRLDVSRLTGDVILAWADGTVQS